MLNKPLHELPASPGERIFIGLGCNLGDCPGNFTTALHLLAQHRIKILHSSPVFRTKPFEVDTLQPYFLNQVVEADTSLSPIELMQTLLAVEAQLGRVRTGSKDPRTLDLDLLAYGNRRIKLEALQLPHPDAHRRAFVLVPWAAIAPAFLLQGMPVGAWRDALPQAERDNVLPTGANAKS